MARTSGWVEVGEEIASLGLRWSPRCKNRMRPKVFRNISPQLSYRKRSTSVSLHGKRLVNFPNVTASRLHRIKWLLCRNLTLYTMFLFQILPIALMPVARKTKRGFALLTEYYSFSWPKSDNKTLGIHSCSSYLTSVPAKRATLRGEPHAQSKPPNSFLR